MARMLMVATVPITLSSFLWPIAQHFRDRGWQVDALTQNRTQEADPRLEAFGRIWGVNWSRNPLNWRNLIGTPQFIHDVVEREGYDLAYVTTPVAAFVSRYALRGLRKRGKTRIIYSAQGFHFYRGGPPVKNMTFMALEKIAARWTDYLIVLNHEDAVAARRFKLLPTECIRYMPGIGVDTKRFAPDAVPNSEVSRVRQELGLASTDRLFLMVAEFIPRKRHRDAFQAFAHLGAEAHLALAGSGPLLEAMKYVASSLGIQERVHFLGFRRDIPALLRASVAVLLPSEQEGLPVSIMEAMSLATPAIGTDIRGIRDLLAQGAGLLVKVGDIEGLAQAMTWVLHHPQEAQAMGQAGRAQAVSTYDIGLILAMHETLFREVLRNKSCT